MCSAVWNFHEDGYELGFNRDEKWSRPISRDPQMEWDHPVPGICARDGRGGGTWLFTNQYGTTLAVMNAYPGGVIPPPGKMSRGMLPLIAAAHASASEIRKALFMETDWHQFAPCQLLLISPGCLMHFAWDGLAFVGLPQPEQDFLTTSSVATEAVKAARISRFGQIASLPIASILDDEIAAAAPFAIHVTREDGGTVSQTKVVVGAHEIHFVSKRRSGSPREILIPRNS